HSSVTRRWRNFLVEGNTLKTGAGYGRGNLEFKRSENVTVRANSIEMPPPPWGLEQPVVRLIDSHGVRVDFNRVCGAYEVILVADATSSDYAESGNYCSPSLPVILGAAPQ
ncbi:MAG: hypothetical protein ACRDJ4_04650, partial [Actinomycetota bacterium]